MTKETFASVAAFKRAMQPGTQWVTLHEYIDGAGETRSGAYDGQLKSGVTDMGVRTCGHVQSNRFAFQTPRGLSWSDFPKASEFTSPAPGVAVITIPGFVRLTYSQVEA